MRKTFWRTTGLLFFGMGSVLAAGEANAAAILLNGSTPVTENFNSFDGTAATVPANFTAGGSWTFGSPGRVFTSGSSAYNSVTGWYALNDDGSTADIAIGGRTNATGGDGSLTWSITNGSGGTLPGLTLSFNVEQYTGSDSGNDLTVTWSPDNSTFGSTNLSGDTSYSIPDTNASNGLLNDPVVTPRTVYLNQPITNGSTVYLRFNWVPVSGGGRPHFGIDDVAVVGVPEPTLLASVGVAGLLLLRRSRR